MERDSPTLLSSLAAEFLISIKTIRLGSMRVWIHLAILRMASDGRPVRAAGAIDAMSR
jgi:hypothetical protein